jgi:NADH-quinone oxidoreductase subunit L
MAQTVLGQLIIAAIPGLPALVFLILALFGRYLQEGAQFVAIFGVATALMFSIFALLDVSGANVLGISGSGQPIDFAVNWINLGEGGSFPMGIYIDGLAAVMLVVVCFVSLMVQLYSGAFMEDDKRFAWYYAVLNLFTASMLGLVVAPNFIELYVFWELVGLCSYLLIGHWFEKPSAAKAAQKAFIVTRVGDAALFIGIIMLWRETGTTSYQGISDAAQAGFVGGSLFTAAVVLIFVGAIGKSAQFPLHVWLPDAMEGPTPVSALIHAATMVAAGVYLVARTYDIFVQSPTAMLVVAYIGGFTALMAATMALTKKDIKRVIAYSTVSQLGVHDDGSGHRGVLGEHLPPLQPCLLQGAAVPRGGQHHLRDEQLQHLRDGWTAPEDAGDFLDHGDRGCLARGDLPVERVLVEGRHRGLGFCGGILHSVWNGVAYGLFDCVLHLPGDLRGVYG